MCVLDPSLTPPLSRTPRRPDPGPHPDRSLLSSLELAGGLLVLLAATRAALIFPMCWIANRVWRMRDPVPREGAAVLWWGGIPRGAITLALGYHCFYQEAAYRTEQQVVISAVIFVVVATTVGLGVVTQPVMQALMPLPGTPPREPPARNPPPERRGSSGGAGEEGNVIDFADTPPAKLPPRDNAHEAAGAAVTAAAAECCMPGNPSRGPRKGGRLSGQGAGGAGAYEEGTQVHEGQLPLLRGGGNGVQSVQCGREGSGLTLVERRSTREATATAADANELLWMGEVPGLPYNATGDGNNVTGPHCSFGVAGTGTGAGNDGGGLGEGFGGGLLPGRSQRQELQFRRHVGDGPSGEMEEEEDGEGVASTWVHRQWRRLDARWLQPLFGGSRADPPVGNIFV
ncbi:hypothetical protein Vafri_3668 [Volvox africanus]|uniref:Cation/H+ exchanger transmembrane domain-containing protein n=1 Tax=Volvox africanus TaxID=51714 RepID=A0A8J4ASE7_9CHLO|nr:hypothetical protein Vafri_3668 [Volvox africanus]